MLQGCTPVHPVRYSPAADKWPSTPDRLSHTNRLSPHFQVVRDAPGLEVKLLPGVVCRALERDGGVKCNGVRIPMATW